MPVPVAWERTNVRAFNQRSMTFRQSMAETSSPTSPGAELFRRRPLRVAFLTPTLLMGGAERWMVSLARRCDRRRITWAGTALSDWAPAKPEICREMSAYMPIYAGPGAGPAEECPAVVRCQSTSEAIRRATRDADILVTWGLADLGPLLAGIDLPVVFVSHGAGDWTARAVQSSESACSHFVAVSETALLPFRPHTRARAIVLHNGVDVERCASTQPREVTRRNLGFDDRAILIGYVGRFSFEKNPLAAAIAARKLGGRYQALYCGEGWKEAEVRAAAVKIAGERVHFVPHLRIVGNILSALDVFMLASPAEGFSLSLAEAWYAGVPTVATRVGAVPELERKYGELVSPVPINPSPRILAKAVLHALTPDFRQEILPRAQRLVAEQYTATAMARRWTDYLETICRDKQ